MAWAISEISSKLFDDFFLAVYVRLENFPVVDAGLPRLARVAKHDALLEFRKVYTQLHAAFAAWGNSIAAAPPKAGG